MIWASLFSVILSKLVGSPAQGVELCFQGGCGPRYSRGRRVKYSAWRTCTDYPDTQLSVMCDRFGRDVFSFRMHATDYLLFWGWVLKRICVQLPPCAPVYHLFSSEKYPHGSRNIRTFHCLPGGFVIATSTHPTMVLFTLWVCTSLYPSHPHPPHPRTQNSATIHVVYAEYECWYGCRVVW